MGWIGFITAKRSGQSEVSSGQGERLWTLSRMQNIGYTLSSQQTEAGLATQAESPEVNALTSISDI
jgi:hypothetical protein